MGAQSPEFEAILCSRYHFIGYSAFVMGIVGGGVGAFYLRQKQKVSVIPSLIGGGVFGYVCGLIGGLAPFVYPF